MKTLSKLSILALAASALVFGQATTPSTTLSAAVTATTACIPLASNTNVVVQGGLFVDLEYMTVIATPVGSACVPVRRGDVSPQGVATAHASSAKVWIAYGNNSPIPGSNGFSYETSFKPYGPAVRSSIPFLPVIKVADGQIWDCALSTSAVSPNTCVWKLISAPVTTVTSVDCAATAACPSTSQPAMHQVIGRGTLVSASPSTYAVTTMTPAFTSTTSYTCVAQDTTTIANNIGVLTAGYVSGTAVTFTGPNTNTDTFRFVCTGF